MSICKRFHRFWSAVAVFATIAVMQPRVLAEPVELRIMSFNVRFSRGAPQEKEAVNDWNDAGHPRRERAIRVIREYKPDLLGVQEARNIQIVDLREALPEFDFYGIGRDDGKTAGEYAGIFYRKDRFASSDAGTFWLSASPAKPGTSFYTAPGAVPRLASWVRLREKPSGRELLVLNTHWDHISDDARRKSATLIRERVTELARGTPAIVMGDLNVNEVSPAYATLVAPAAERSAVTLRDSYRQLHAERRTDEASFNDWHGTTKGSRIDFILHTPEIKSTAAEIVRTSYDGLRPSDHYPVTATLVLDNR